MRWLEILESTAARLTKVLAMSTRNLPPEESAGRHEPGRLLRTTHVDRPIDEVFEFFSDAGNLEALTPPWVSFAILTPRPVAMAEGTIIDYRIRLHGIPLPWRSEITAWEPPHRFVDIERRGPYRTWIHEHRFAERDGGTDVIDDVRFSVWGGALIERLFVRRDLRRIFDYRHQRLHELLAP